MPCIEFTCSTSPWKITFCSTNRNWQHSPGVKRKMNQETRIPRVPVLRHLRSRTREKARACEHVVKITRTKRIANPSHWLHTNQSWNTFWHGTDGKLMIFFWNRIVSRLLFEKNAMFPKRVFTLSSPTSFILQRTQQLSSIYYSSPSSKRRWIPKQRRIHCIGQTGIDTTMNINTTSLHTSNFDAQVQELSVPPPESFSLAATLQLLDPFETTTKANEDDADASHTSRVFLMTPS